MRVALVALIAGTLLSGFAAAYATSTQRMSRSTGTNAADAGSYISPYDKPDPGRLASK